ncbi:hypothetical protein D9V84_01600 [Bacteroidetes/Chlorobi group bacterium Naka2016]|nr:MAG: hypothetical protein D9V84_01600 [Bacteroidetes/Chlorobi group bacterium Naka2016]
MAVRFTRIVLILLFDFTLLIAQITKPSPVDSIIAGRNVVFNFQTKAISLQKLDFSIDKKNWIEIGKFLNKEELTWLPPLLDIDTIYFHYEAFNFTIPIKLWEVEKANSSEVSSIDYWEADSLFLTSSLNGELIIWDISSRKKLDSLVWGKAILSAKFFHSSSKVVFSSDTAVFLWDFSNPTELRMIGNSSATVRALAVDNQKKLVAFGSYSGELVVLDSNLNEILRLNHNKQIYSLAFSKQGNLLAVGDYEGFVTIYDLLKGKKLKSFSTNRDSSFKNVVWSISFDSNDILIIAGGIDGKSRIYNINNESLDYVISSHSFHIRGVDFCDYAPVAISVSLDSNLVQTYFPMNFPVHFPIKEKSAITFLKTIDGGRYLFLGMRDGTISFYKNFEFEHIDQRLALPFFIPVMVQCKSFEANAGRMASFPIIFKNLLEVPLNRFFSDTSFAVLEVPKEHFGVYHPENRTVKYGPVDTIYSRLSSIGSLDTFQIVQVYALLPWGERKAPFKVNYVDFRGKRNILWLFDTAFVDIVEICKPLNDLVKLELIPKINFVVKDNPVSEFINLIVEADNSVFCKFALVNSIDGGTKILYSGEIHSGKTELNFNIGDFPSGVYLLLLETDFVSLAKKLIIY